MRPHAPLPLLLLCAACAAPPAAAPWTDCFDGRSLASWEVTDFGGQGPVAVQGGSLELGFGSPLTGVTFTGTPPAGSYELEVCAARLEGRDFFCGLTFPVRDGHLTLVLGGWGGSLVGLSSLDGTRKVDADLRGRELGLRPEVLLSRPLGIASFTTRAAIHSVRWRPLGTADASGSSHDRTR